MPKTSKSTKSRQQRGRKSWDTRGKGKRKRKDAMIRHYRQTATKLPHLLRRLLEIQQLLLKVLLLLLYIIIIIIYHYYGYYYYIN